MGLGAGQGGWCWVFDSEEELHRAITGEAPAFRTWVRFAEDAGRLRVVELLMAGPINTDALRSVPLGELERLANSPNMREAILERINKRSPVAVEESHFSSDGESPSPPDAPLKFPPVPSGRQPVPDDFYQAIADLYSRVGGRSPAKTIAEEMSVSPGRVHGWVKEARARGLLPPGHRRSARG